MRDKATQRESNRLSSSSVTAPEESAHTGAVVADVGFAGAANCKNGYLSHASDDPCRF